MREREGTNESCFTSWSFLPQFPLLHFLAADEGDVEVSPTIQANPVSHVLQAAAGLPARELVALLIEHADGAVAAIGQVDAVLVQAQAVGGAGVGPLLEELAALIEYLQAAVLAVSDD